MIQSSSAQSSVLCQSGAELVALWSGTPTDCGCYLPASRPFQCFWGTDGYCIPQYQGQRGFLATSSTSATTQAFMDNVLMFDSTDFSQSCINVNSKTSPMEFLFQVRVPTAVQARTFFPILTKSTVSDTQFQTATVSVSISATGVTTKTPNFTAIGSNSVWTSGKEMLTIKWMNLWITYNSVTIDQPLSPCLDGFFAIKEYYLNPYLKMSFQRFFYSNQTVQLNYTVPFSAHFAANFSQGPKCPSAFSDSAASDTSLVALFSPQGDEFKSTVGSVLLTSFLFQAGSQHATPSKVQIQYWNYNSTQKWENTSTPQINVQSNHFRVLASPYIAFRINNVPDQYTHNVCSFQFFGYPFCQVKSIQVTSSLLENFNSNSSTYTTYAQITSQYGEMLSNNPFCSLGIAITIYLDGIGQEIEFGYDNSTSKTVALQNATFVNQGITQQFNFSLDPRTLILTVVNTCNIFDSITRTNKISFWVVDSRDSSAVAVLSEIITFNYQNSIPMNCRNTQLQTTVVLLNQVIYHQGLNLFIDSHSDQQYQYKIAISDICAPQNQIICPTINTCGLYYFELTANTTDSNYQKAQNLLNSGSDLMFSVSSDTHSIQITIKSTNRVYAGLQLSYTLTVGLSAFNAFLTSLDPKKTFNIVMTFIDFQPKNNLQIVNFQLGSVESKIVLPGYTISPKNYSLLAISTKQIAGIGLLSQQYIFDSNDLSFQLLTDNIALANQNVQFQFTAKINDPFQTNNSDFILSINFVAASPGIAIPLNSTLQQNTAPYFTDSIFKPNPISCLEQNNVHNWNFTFPQAFDDQQNVIQFQIDCNTTNGLFGIKESQKALFSIFLNDSFQQLSVPPQFSCKANLIDTYKAKKSYLVTFNYICENFNNQVQIKKKTYKLEIPRPKISNISQDGLLTIAWNIEMLIPVKSRSLYQDNYYSSALDCYNISPFKIAIEPATQQNLKMDQKFTISNITYKPNSTIVSIFFQRPQDISFYAKDNLILKINNTQCFQSISSAFVDENITLIYRIPKQNWKIVIQIPNQLSTVVQGVIYTTVSLVILSFFTQAALNFLLQMISNLSILVHMFLVSLNFPQNLLNFMGILLPLITFSVIPPDVLNQWFEKMFHLTEIYDYSLSNQYESIGYPSIFVINNSGFLYFYIQMGPLLLLILYVCNRCSVFSSCDPLKTLIQHIAKQVYWNGLIHFCYQNYLVICVVSMIESNDLRLTSEYSVTEIYCSVLAICGMVFAVVFPIFIFYSYYQAIKPDNVRFTRQELVYNMLRFNVSYEDLFTQQFIYKSLAYQKFIDYNGVLIKDIDITRTGPVIAILCPFVDLTFQLILAVTVTRLVNWPIFSIFSFNFILLVYLMFFIYVSPFKKTMTQFWAIFDKIVLLGLNYHFFLFTDYIVEVKNYAGIANSVIYIVSGASLLRVWYELTLKFFALIKLSKQAYESLKQRLHRIKIVSTRTKNELEFPNKFQNLKASDGSQQKEVRFNQIVKQKEYKETDRIQTPFKKTQQNQISILKNPIQTQQTRIQIQTPIQKHQTPRVPQSSRQETKQQLQQQTEVQNLHVSAKQKQNAPNAVHAESQITQINSKQKVIRNQSNQILTDSYQQAPQIKKDYGLEIVADPELIDGKYLPVGSKIRTEYFRSIQKKDPYSLELSPIQGELRKPRHPEITLEDLYDPQRQPDRQPGARQPTLSRLQLVRMLSQGLQDPNSLLISPVNLPKTEAQKYNRAAIPTVSQKCKDQIARMRVRNAELKKKDAEGKRIVACPWDAKFEGYVRDDGIFYVSGVKQPNTPDF